MQEWYKQNKKKNFIFFLFTFIFFIPLVTAIDECKGVVTRDEIPCLVLLSFNVTPLVCGSHAVSFYNESSLLYTQTMGDYSPAKCNATFNQSKVGTYNCIYSTGDTCSITVEEGLTRFLVYLVMFVMLVSFLILGYYFEQPILHYMVGFMTPIMALDVFRSGFPRVTDVFLTNSIAIILAGIGFYYLVVPSLRAIAEWQQ